MKAVLIRNMPEELHRRVKASACLAGKSLESYVMGVLDSTSIDKEQLQKFTVNDDKENDK